VTHLGALLKNGSNQLHSRHSFKKLIVDPTISRFKSDPSSLVDAFHTIWVIDAYGSHVAKDIGRNEATFKNSVADKSQEFSLIRSACNAIKHVQRDQDFQDVLESDWIEIEDVSGIKYYFNQAEHWGKQAVLRTSWKWNADQNGFEKPLKKGTPQQAPNTLLNVHPLFDLTTPALAAIDAQALNYTTKQQAL
jgi:hypothetical protein